MGVLRRNLETPFFSELTDAPLSSNSSWTVALPAYYPRVPSKQAFLTTPSRHQGLQKYQSSVRRLPKFHRARSDNGAPGIPTHIPAACPDFCSGLFQSLIEFRVWCAVKLVLLQDDLYELPNSSSRVVSPLTVCATRVNPHPCLSEAESRQSEFAIGVQTTPGAFHFGNAVPGRHDGGAMIRSYSAA
jgi:hypothetical protein